MGEGLSVPGVPSIGREGLGGVVLATATTDYFARYRAALNASKAGTARTVIAMVGDSTTAGAYGGNPTPTSSNGYGNNSRGGSVPTNVAALFVSSGGLPAMGPNIFGNANATGSGTYNAYDSNGYLGSGWAPSSSAATLSLGDEMFTAANGSTGAFGLFDSVSDTVDVYYAKNSGLNSATQVRLNNTQVGTINQNGTVGVAKATFSGTPSSSGIVCYQGGGSTGPSYIIGLESRLASRKGVSVFNMGWGGSATTDWTETTSSKFTAIQTLPIVPADLTIINLGINDWQNGVSLSIYQANLQTLITTCKANANGGDVMLVAPNRTDTALTPQATQEQYVAAMQSVAQAAGVKFFDIATIANFATYAQASAAGYMGDQRHPNATGYGIIASALYSVLSNP